jgi:cation transport regulator
MPYQTNSDLPPSVRRNLPEHAQDIYRKAFNHAYFAHFDDPDRETVSHRIAWGAVKRAYFKSGAGWLAIRDFRSR